MGTIISGIAATLIMLPFISYLAVFIIVKELRGSHYRAVRIAVNISTVFFIASVYYLILVIWGLRLFPVLFLVMVCLAALTAVLHYTIKGEIVFVKVLKGFWRSCFAVFSFTYAVLAVVGVIKRVLLALI